MTSAEASAPPVQTGYFDPNNPGQAYVPPPAYYNDPPPGYTDTTDKKNDWTKKFGQIYLDLHFCHFSVFGVQNDLPNSSIEVDYSAPLPF